ncbi:Pyridine nucleotide-disulfide oxidoreductase [Gracilaria domingensis]|nr:Pyridine nucleotide-disulfide oxidoreductase [Gracilaria domingensis]
MHVVVIGGGVAGLAAINALHAKVANDSTISITLVEPKSFIEVTWAAIRAMFDRNMARNTVIPISDFLKKHPAVKHVKAKVKTLEKTAAVLDNSERLEFDVCLVAAGASSDVEFFDPLINPSVSQPEAKSVKGRLAALEASGKSLLAAKSVLVVGGGAIGTEIASDIAGFAALQRGPKPSVTLVHSKAHLVPEFNKTSAAKILRMLQDLGVTVYLNNKAVEKDGKWILESSGQQIETDTVIKAIGVRPQNDFMKSHLANALDEKGWITVDDNFRVPGTAGRIFAVGDCSNSSAKTGAIAMANKNVIATNIFKTICALKEKESLDSVGNLATKVGGPPLFLVTAGPKKGVVQTPLGALTWGLPALKNKTMFIFRLRGQIGI